MRMITLYIYIYIYIYKLLILNTFAQFKHKGKYIITARTPKLASFFN